MRRHRIEIYRDAAYLYRWRLRSPNGRIMADGAEGYTRRDDVRRALRGLGLKVAAARVESL